jgi:hypothetical protein
MIGTRVADIHMTINNGQCFPGPSLSLCASQAQIRPCLEKYLIWGSLDQTRDTGGKWSGKSAELELFDVSLGRFGADEAAADHDN